jgi:L-aspartate oxidase
MLENHPIVIIGAGIAGSTVALKLSELRPDLKILVLSKSSLSQCSSFMAQGGIASEYKTSETDIETHIEDTLKAGRYMNDEQTVRWWAHQTENGIDQLLQWGVIFNSEMALEGGHTTRRIFKVEDQTGRSIMQVLWDKMLERKNISIVENTSLINIKKDLLQNIFYLDVVTEQGTRKNICASHVVFASGGLGRLIAPSTSSPIATAEVMGMAIHLGVRTNFLSCVQFHPTGLFVRNAKQTLLISEAVRGEGARLVNSLGEYFMIKYDIRKDLASRDIVSRAIFEEMQLTHSDCVYLDARNMNKEEWLHKFPYIYTQLMNHSIFPEKDLIPVYPVAHYMCGGIVTDRSGLTNIEGLYAVGEVACTGIHGYNRLASNSLSEAVVFGLSLAQFLAGKEISFNKKIIPSMLPENTDANKEAGIITEMNLISENLYAVYKNQKTKQEVEYLISHYEDTLRCIHEHTTLYFSLLVVIKILKDYSIRFTNNDIKMQHV